MEGERKCRRRVLAADASFRIEECDCGAIHLVAGFATLRLDRPAFRELAAVLAEAINRLDPPPRFH
jgi:hypothetical protein